jgi:parallel beta-helix repeat protein
VYIEQAQNNTIVGNSIQNNAAVGVYLFDGALGNVVQGNTIHRNTYGIFLFNSAGNADSIRRARNKNSGNRTANFREFTGRVTPRVGTGTQPPATPHGPKVKGRALSGHHRK